MKPRFFPPFPREKAIIMESTANNSNVSIAFESCAGLDDESDGGIAKIQDLAMTTFHSE